MVNGIRHRNDLIPPGHLNSNGMLDKALETRNFKEVFQILSSPQAGQIPPNLLGCTLVEIAREQDVNALRLIVSLPNFLDIEADGEWGLSEALQSSLANPHPDVTPEFLRAIVEHPEADQIDSYGTEIPELIGRYLLGIAQRGEHRYNEDDRATVHLLLHRNIASHVNAVGQFGLGRVLVNAAWATLPDFVNAILGHESANEISSNEVVHANKAMPIEGDWGMDHFGFAEAIFAAINNGNPHIHDDRAANLLAENQQVAEIVTSIFNYVTEHQVHLNANGRFGLADSLTSAAEDQPEIVPLILGFPGSLEIALVAGEDEGSLSNALFNAGREGHENAVRSILGYPRATELAAHNLREAADEAARNEHHKIADLIRERL